MPFRNGECPPVCLVSWRRGHQRGRRERMRDFAWAMAIAISGTAGTVLGVFVTAVLLRIPQPMLHAGAVIGAAVGTGLPMLAWWRLGQTRGDNR